jgi:retinol dehydrogenase-14
VESEPSLDVLINNAGVFQPPFALTEDGFETQFATNHFNHALLTLLLLPKLEESGTDSQPARIVMVTSTLYEYGKVRDVDFRPRGVCSDLYDKRKAYQNSKLCALLFSQELSRRLQERRTPVNVYVASPGLVLTNLGRHVKYSWPKMLLLIPLSIFLRSPSQGCQTVLHCAVSQALSGSTGKFYRNCKETMFRGEVRDTVSRAVMARDVYQKTLKAISWKAD